MKLSTAIRLGAMLGPQAFGRLDDATTGGTCAYGAALQAAGLDFYDTWKLTGVFHAMCPACADAQRAADRYRFNTLAHLNDTHRWTREQIADWVQTIEEQAVAKAGEAQAVEPVPVSVGEPLAR
jgi:hypothetical protein